MHETWAMLGHANLNSTWALPNPNLPAHNIPQSKHTSKMHETLL